MGKALLSLIVAFFGNSLMNIGQATQKIGLGNLPDKKAKAWIIWAIGTLSITAATFIIMYAVSIGNVSLVGAMAGAGLASLTLFSKFVMKEEVGKQEIIGVLIIFGAAVLIGAFSKEAPASEILINRLYIFLGIITVLYVIGWALFSKKDNIIGLIIGGFAGALGGFVPLFQKVSTSELGKATSFIKQAATNTESIGGQIAAIFTNPYAIIWVVLSIISMLVLQFSYKKDKAIRIIPAFAANYILVPVIGGVICFREVLNPMQWIGVVLIFVGVFFITMKFKKAK